MITYDKSWWGNKVLFRAYGSAFPRSLPYACVAALIAATLSALFDTTGWELFSNAYPVQMFFFVVGFMVIFRYDRLSCLPASAVPMPTVRRLALHAASRSVEP